MRAHSAHPSPHATAADDDDDVGVVVVFVIYWGPTTLLFRNTYAITPASCYICICCDCDAYSLLLYI